MPHLPSSQLLISGLLFGGSIALTSANASETLHWRFEEGGGTTVADASTAGADGFLNSVPLWSSSVAVSPVPQSAFANGRSLDLNWQSTATAGFVTIPETGDLSPGEGSFTLEAWVRLDSVSDTSSADQRQYLFQKKPVASSDTQTDYAFMIQAGNFGFTGRELAFNFGDGFSINRVLSSFEIADLDWHFVSLAYDADNDEVRFGLDGAYETLAAAKPPLGNSGPLLIGAHENASGAFNQFLRGSVDEARLTKRFLEPAELLDGASIDCDGNGAPDFVEELAGTLLDCNRNGSPDSCDIASGESGDCQLDGIPDECQLVDLFLKNHTDDSDVIVKSDGDYTALVESLEVTDGLTVITHVDMYQNVGFGNVIGSNMTIYVWSDPNGDKDPTDAQVLASASTTVTADMIGKSNRYDIPDTFLGPDGTRFFAGAVIETPGASGATFDVVSPHEPGCAWVIGSNSPIDPNNLALNAVEFATTDAAIPFSGHWYVGGVVEAPEDDCNQNGVPDGCDIAFGTSADVDLNNVPDECENAGFFFVPDDFSSIQGALDVVISGSTVVVRAGYYFENLNFNGKDIDLRSESGPEVTVIDGAGLAAVVTFNSGEGPGASISGFTLRGGDRGVVILGASSPTVSGNIIRENVTDDSGAGVLVNGLSFALLLDNEISANSAGGSGGGICLVLDNSAPLVTGNTIIDNLVGGDGGGIYSENGSPVITDNRVVGNISPNSGGGLFMIFSAGFPATVGRNLFAANTAGDDGGGIWTSNSSPDLFDNVIVGNSAPSGGGLYLRGMTQPVLRNTIYQNAATTQGGGIFFDGNDSACAISSSIVWGNGAPSDPQLHLGGNVVTVDHSDVEGGWPGLGNFDADPLFVDLDGPDDTVGTFLDNDYRLSGASACVDAGDPADVSCTETDLGGIPRLLDGLLAGVARVDVGAHEFSNVYLSVGGDTTPGGTLIVNTAGTPGLLTWLFVGFQPATLCVPNAGGVFFDVAGAVSFPWVSAPSSLPVPLSPATPTPLPLVLQQVVAGPLGANTSNAVTLVIE